MVRRCRLVRVAAAQTRAEAGGEARRAAAQLPMPLAAWRREAMLMAHATASTPEALPRKTLLSAMTYVAVNGKMETPRRQMMQTPMRAIVDVSRG